MKQYMEVMQSNDECCCSACGRSIKDNTLIEKFVYDISFVSEYSNGNTHSQSFKICWDCTEVLVDKLEKARYDSVANELTKGE